MNSWTARASYRGPVSKIPKKMKEEEKDEEEKEKTQLPSHRAHPTRSRNKQGLLL
jgi:hypothetical protein